VRYDRMDRRAAWDASFEDMHFGRDPRRQADLASAYAAPECDTNEADEEDDEDVE